MKHVLNDTPYKIKALRWVQCPNKKGTALVLLRIHSKTQLPKPLTKYCRAITPRRDQLLNWLNQLSSTYAGRIPSETEYMQGHFAWLKDQYERYILPDEQVYQMLQAYVGYIYEYLDSPKNMSDFVQCIGELTREESRNFKFGDIELVHCLPDTAGFYGWVEKI